MEGGRQLHDVPCIPQRRGFKGAATAIETAAACEGALRVLPQPERNDQAAERGDVCWRPEPGEQRARGPGSRVRRLPQWRRRPAHDGGNGGEGGIRSLFSRTVAW